MSYYRNRKYEDDKPATAWEAQNTWTLILVWIELKRNANLFWIALALPSFISTLLNLLSFLIPQAEHAILIVVTNFFLQSVFLRDAVKELPPVVEDTSPRIVKYANCMLVATTIVLALHLCSMKVRGKKHKIPELFAAERTKPLLKYLSWEKDSGMKESNEQEDVINTCVLFRNCCLLSYLVVTFCLLIICFL